MHIEIIPDIRFSALCGTGRISSFPTSNKISNILLKGKREKLTNCCATNGISIITGIKILGNLLNPRPSNSPLLEIKIKPRSEGIKSGSWVKNCIM